MNKQSQKPDILIFLSDQHTPLYSKSSRAEYPKINRSGFLIFTGLYVLSSVCPRENVHAFRAVSF